MATVWIPPLMRPLTDGQQIVEAEGESVRELVAALEERFPGIADRIIDEGRIRPGWTVAVDGAVQNRGPARRRGPGQRSALRSLDGRRQFGLNPTCPTGQSSTSDRRDAAGLSVGWYSPKCMTFYLASLELSSSCQTVSKPKTRQPAPELPGLSIGLPASGGRSHFCTRPITVTAHRVVDRRNDNWNSPTP